MNKLFFLLLLLPLVGIAQSIESEQEIAQYLSNYAADANKISLENNVLTISIGDMSKPTGLRFDIDLSKTISVSSENLNGVQRFFITSSEEGAIHYQHGNSQRTAGFRAYFLLQNASSDIVASITNHLR